MNPTKQATAERLVAARQFNGIISQADQDALGISRADGETVNAALRRSIAWTARCNCYCGGAGHSVNSGRCGATHVFDPAQDLGGFARCAPCRKNC